MQEQIWRWTIQRTIVVLWKGTLNALKNAGEYTKLVNSLTEALVHVYSVYGVNGVYPYLYRTLCVITLNWMSLGFCL